MSTYEKLGQYAAAELPYAPSEVLVTDIGNTDITLQWQNNYINSNTVIVQQWLTNYWYTLVELENTATGYTIQSLSQGQSYRLRVAVLENGIIYPCQPIIASTLSLPFPTNIAYSGNDSGFTSTITWGGNDPSWERLYIRALLNTEASCNEEVWTTIATLMGSGNTSYGIKGYAWMANKNVSIGMRMAGVDYYQDNTYIEIPKIVGQENDRLYVGGTIIMNWVSWAESYSNSREIYAINNSRYQYMGCLPQVCSSHEPLYAENYSGTFSIRTQKEQADNRPIWYELTPADFLVKTGCADNGDGTFKLTCGQSSINQYNIKINMSGSRSIVITKYEE